MAKFTAGDLRLKDGQKITFGTDLDSDLYFDGTELGFTTVVSGLDPTQSYHLTTKNYVDSNIVTDHGSLTGLTDDDHTQYVPTDASRGFTATVSGIDPTQDYHLATKSYVDSAGTTDHGGLTGLDDDDHTQYILTTGARGFTGTVSGVDPTLSYHLTTKSYVDSTVVTDHGGLSGLTDDDHTQYILTDGSRGFTGTVSGVDPTQSYHLTTKSYVDLTAQGLDWQDSVLSMTTAYGDAAASGTNRYIAPSTSGTWTEDYIYEWNGSTWDETVPNEGFAAWVEDEDSLYVYNGVDWVQFGSTVTHNNLSGLQGGTSSEYYHMTSTMYSALTSDGGVDDAGSQHHHDGRYYTESEVDTISGALSSEIDSDIATHTAISSAHHTRYTDEEAQDAVGSIMSGAGSVTVTYDDAGNTITVSGTDTGETDHGALTGLGDDDHAQYVPTDGSRGFTATVSGVDPTQSYHLATKSYVDSGGVDRHGRTSIANGASTVTVSFSELGHTNYTVNATMENTTDSPPSIYAFIVSTRTSSSFTVTFMGDMDSANYDLNWSVIED